VNCHSSQNYLEGMSLDIRAIVHNSFIALAEWHFEIKGLSDRIMSMNSIDNFSSLFYYHSLKAQPRQSQKHLCINSLIYKLYNAFV
jgi:hypothetical protein